jgi:hypothetical protein
VAEVIGHHERDFRSRLPFPLVSKIEGSMNLDERLVMIAVRPSGHHPQRTPPLRNEV